MRRAPRSPRARIAPAAVGAALLAAFAALGGLSACAAPRVLPSDGADGRPPLVVPSDDSKRGLPSGEAPDKAGTGSASIEAAGVKSFSLSWRDGEVRIAATDEGDRIELTERGEQDAPDDRRASWSVSGGELRVEDGRGDVRDKSEHRRLEVLVPRSVAQKLGSVDIKGASGSYDVGGLGCDSMAIDLSSGSLNGHDLSAKELKTNLSQGSLRMSGSFPDSVSAAAASGRTSIACEGGCPRTAHADVARGKVELLVPDNSGFTLRIEKLGGKFSSDFSLRRDGGAYVAGDGSSDISAKLASGAFRIARLER